MESELSGPTPAKNTDERSDPEASPTATASNFRGFLKSWRYFFLLLAAAVLVALFYAEENWRGTLAWTDYKKKALARGVPMEPASIIPKPVPLSENFASTPFLAPLFDFIPGTQRWRTTNAVNLAQSFAPAYEAASRHLPSPKRSSSNSWFTTSVDLTAWYRAFQTPTNYNHRGGDNPVSAPVPDIPIDQAATGVLAGLAEAEPVIDELRQASRRPYCRFEIQYDTDDPAAILLPHLAVLRRLGNLLQLRVAAELASGRITEAAQDVELMLYLADAMRDEPIVISQIVRMLHARQAIQCIGEGIGHWSEPQLRSFQERLQQFDFCVSLQRALEAERVFFGGGMIDFVQRNPEVYNNVLGGENTRELSFPGVLWAAAPRGWFDLEKLNYHLTFDQYRIPGLNLPDHLITPAALALADGRITRLAKRPWPLVFVRHEVFSALLLPGFPGAYRQTAFAQTAVDIASIACAIERYRLAHGGRPPDTLDLLTQIESANGHVSSAPLISPLPRDVINGQPLKYRLEGDGYVLYSIGWNAVDDGGTNVTLKAEDGQRGREMWRGDVPLQGDWVWPQRAR